MLPVSRTETVNTHGHYVLLLISLLYTRMCEIPYWLVKQNMMAFTFRCKVFRMGARPIRTRNTFRAGCRFPSCKTGRRRTRVHLRIAAELLEQRSEIQHDYGRRDLYSVTEKKSSAIIRNKGDICFFISVQVQISGENQTRTRHFADLRE